MNTPVACISLDAIQQNINVVRMMAANSKVMAVVKADAYGHGARQICQSIQHVDALAVGRVSEGITLREAGIALPILVLEGFIDGIELEHCRIDRLVPVLHSDYQLALLGSGKHREMAVWLKVDSGMHRLGFTPEDFRRCVSSGTVTLLTPTSRITGKREIRSMYSSN